VKDVPRPKLEANHLVLRVLVLRVLACGLCRTDLHIVEGDLPPQVPELIPGRQIIGEVDIHVAPLLCAGIIGFGSLRVAGVEPGERVGLFGAVRGLSY
jgi:propanol-preferring alcohol dehydrogenase